MNLIATITMIDNSVIEVPFTAESTASAMRCTDDKSQWLQFDNVFVFPCSAREIHYSDGSASFGGIVA